MPALIAIRMANPKREFSATKTVERNDSFVLSDQVFENRQGFPPAGSRHAGKVRNADDSDAIADVQLLAGAVYSLLLFHLIG